MSRGFQIRDRETGELAPGRWLVGDDWLDPASPPECPVCGSDSTQACTVPDGGEVGAYVHVERVEAWEKPTPQGAQ